MFSSTLRNLYLSLKYNSIKAISEKIKCELETNMTTHDDLIRCQHKNLVLIVVINIKSFITGLQYKKTLLYFIELPQNTQTMFQLRKEKDTRKKRNCRRE